jgi:hypothetical protein
LFPTYAKAISINNGRCKKKLLMDFSKWGKMFSKSISFNILAKKKRFKATVVGLGKCQYRSQCYKRKLQRQRNT